MHRDDDSLLSKGRIPARTVCPWRDQCMTAAAGKCRHKGLAHKNKFSCGLARAFDMTEAYIRRASVAKLVASNLVWNKVNFSPEIKPEKACI